MSVRIEHAPRAVLETLQLERLQELARAPQRTPRGAALPDDRLARRPAQLPFTVKDDLRDELPARPARRRRATSCAASTPPPARGGTPTVVAYTRARPRRLVGGDGALHGDGRRAGPGMVVHNAYGYGLFTGGLGFHQGAERLGALVIPVSGGVTARQATLLRDLGGQVLCCTPSYALHIAQGLREAGIDADELALEIGMFGAEPWTEAMRDAARGRARPDGAQHLRPVGDRRPGRRRRVPRGAATACTCRRTTSWSRSIDPDTGEPRPGRHRRRARLHDADQGGAAAAALPHRRHRVS